MAGRNLSLRRLATHRLAAGPRSTVALRQTLGRPSGTIRLGVRNAPISVLIHNMALLPDLGLVNPYLGTDRAGVVSEICARIRALSPDIVGLCEVFEFVEAFEIIATLDDLYPFARNGPAHPGLSFEEGGGLVLLSKFPPLAEDAFIFPDTDGIDSWASKGIFHIRVRGPSWPSALDVFYSHTQNPSTGSWVRGLYPDDFPGPHLSTGEAALYAQLDSMRDFVDSHADLALPALIMGDLNIPATNSAHYRTLLNTLGGFRDTWTLAGNTATSGPTYVADNNFYEDIDDRPGSDERLDYILLRSGSRACPITADVSVVRFKHNGRFISDHFGVLAVFDPIAVVHP